MCWRHRCSTFSFDVVLATAMEDHAGDGVNVLYHPEGELVGSRKMSEKRLVQDLEYAHDMCLVAASRDSLEGMLHSLDKACTDMGSTINTKKIKILAVLHISNPILDKFS